MIRTRLMTLTLLSVVLVASACGASNEPEVDTRVIPYDAKAPDYIVHEVKPQEADYAYLKKHLKRMEHLLHGEKPEEVPVKKWVRYEDQLEVLIKCIREQGVPVKAEQNGFSANFENESEEIAHDKAMYYCNAMYPAFEVTARDFTEAQGRQYYQYLIKTTIPCLKQNGFKVTFNPPSEEKFLETMREPGEYTPFNELPRRDYNDAVERCPLRPIYEQLWGKY